MKTLFIKSSLLAIVLAGSTMYAQENSLRQYLAPEKYSRGVFEDPKVEAPEYDGVKVSIGGDFSLQFQGLDHSTANTNLGFVRNAVTSVPTGTAPTTYGTTPNTLLILGEDFNLPTANLDVNAYLSTGVKLHLRTYLSARHHNEAWVKGGYIQIDNLDFISKGLLSGVMKYTRFRFGMDDLNYGDSHFRRSDNAYALNNPFIENNIMDSFTTQPFAEGYVFYNGFIGMVGVSNGKMSQSVVNTATSNVNPSVYAKIGYDKQVAPNLRVRLTGSAIKTSGMTTNGQLYGDERAGSRYYYVLLTADDQVKATNAGKSFATENGSTGRFNPGFKEMLAFQVNPFVKYGGLELFGTLEFASGNKVLNATTKRDTDGSYTQIAGDLIYRFGNKEQFYLGGRYNTVNGKDYKGQDSRNIERWNANAGWYMTKNILTKVEYVEQKYNESIAWGATSPLKGGKFKGIVVEATIGF